MTTKLNQWQKQKARKKTNKQKVRIGEGGHMKRKRC